MKEQTQAEIDRLIELNASPLQCKAYFTVKERWHKVGLPYPMLGDASCLMVDVSGENGNAMQLGIEQDGHTHS
jgi:hypothetical protein